MTRTISASMAGILERLELERPIIVTSEALSRILQEEGIQTPARIVAARLREKGWLLPTQCRGAWEFVPASSAGAYSSNDPLLHIKSLMSKHPVIAFGLTFHTAAWIHGAADRIPSHIEIAAGNTQTARIMHGGMYISVFSPRLAYMEIRGVPVLAPESVIVHMAAKPGAVRSWQSALEWLPELSGLLTVSSINEEISSSSSAVIARTGYLLQGLRPDIADSLFVQNPPKYKTWFGPHAPLLRHDNKWMVADTMLPFDPRGIGAVI